MFLLNHAIPYILRLQTCAYKRSISKRLLQYKYSPNLRPFCYLRTSSNTTALRPSSYSRDSWKFFETSIWMNFKADCTPLCFAVSDATFNFLSGFRKDFRPSHALFQNPLPFLDLGAMISDFVVNGLLGHCLAIFVNFSREFNGFIESMVFQVCYNHFQKCWDKCPKYTLVTQR